MKELKVECQRCITYEVEKMPRISNLFVSIYLMGVVIEAIGFTLFIQIKTRRRLDSSLISLLNKKLKYLVPLFFIIGLCVFMINTTKMSLGGPEKIGDNYYIVDKGHIVSEITFEDYNQYRIYSFQTNLYIFFFINIITICLIDISNKLLDKQV